jgi:hypothetical protein
MPGGEAPTALSYQGNITIPTQTSAEGQATGPAAGATIVTSAPPPGAYTVAWEVWLESGTPGTNDANNFGLYVGSTLIETSINPATVTGQPVIQGAVQVNVPVSGTVLVKAIAASNGTSVVYAAQVSSVPLAVVSPDDPLYPYNPLTADGTSVNITSTPANLATTLQGFDLSEGSECQVGRGSLVPSGTSNFGFVDTTYSVTQAQMLTAPFGQPGSGQYNY